MQIVLLPVLQTDLDRPRHYLFVSIKCAFFAVIKGATSDVLVNIDVFNSIVVLAMLLQQE